MSKFFMKDTDLFSDSMRILSGILGDAAEDAADVLDKKRKKAGLKHHKDKIKALEDKLKKEKKALKKAKKKKKHSSLLEEEHTLIAKFAKKWMKLRRRFVRE